MFFAPRGVAVVGASRDPAKVGHAALRNLLFGGPGDDRKQGFQGEIRAVNPNAKEILLEFGGFVVHDEEGEIFRHDGYADGDAYSLKLTNELFIYQRANVRIDDDDVDVYVLVDRVG